MKWKYEAVNRHGHLLIIDGRPPDPVYLDRDHGDDSGDGLMPETAKRTDRAAADAIRQATRGMAFEIGVEAVLGVEP